MEEMIIKIVNEIKKQGLTASKVENETDIGKNTIAMWKRGTQPTVEKLIKVIKYLGMSADDLFNISINRDTKIVTVPSYTVDTSKDLKWIYKCLNMAETEVNIDEMREDIAGTKRYIEKILEKYNDAKYNDIE